MGAVFCCAIFHISIIFWPCVRAKRGKHQRNVPSCHTLAIIPGKFPRRCKIRKFANPSLPKEGRCIGAVRVTIYSKRYFCIDAFSIVIGSMVCQLIWIHKGNNITFVSPITPPIDTKEREVFCHWKIPLNRTKEEVELKPNTSFATSQSKIHE